MLSEHICFNYLTLSWRISIINMLMFYLTKRNNFSSFDRLNCQLSILKFLTNHNSVRSSSHKMNLWINHIKSTSTAKHLEAPCLKWNVMPQIWLLVLGFVFMFLYGYFSIFVSPTLHYCARQFAIRAKVVQEGR